MVWDGATILVESEPLLPFAPPSRTFTQLNSYPLPARERPNLRAVGALANPLVPNSTPKTKPRKRKTQALFGQNCPSTPHSSSPHFPILFLPGFKGVPAPRSGLPNRSAIASTTIYVLLFCGNSRRRFHSFTPYWGMK